MYFILISYLLQAEILHLVHLVSWFFNILNPGGEIEEKEQECEVVVVD